MITIGLAEATYLMAEDLMIKILCHNTAMHSILISVCACLHVELILVSSIPGEQPSLPIRNCVLAVCSLVSLLVCRVRSHYCCKRHIVVTTLSYMRKNVCSFFFHME